MVIALGIDVGSTAVKASVVELTESVRELAVATASVAGLDAPALVRAALAAAAAALERAAAGPARVVGIASMAETGAITDADGSSHGALVRWDRLPDHRRRDELEARLDPRALHATTGVPLTRKLPLLTWVELATGQDEPPRHWAFTADLVAAALTGRRATDHTLAGRSGALPLPEASASLTLAWDDELLAAFGIARGFAPDVLAPGEPAGIVSQEAVAALGGLVDPDGSVYIAGHDHAVAAWIGSARSRGRRVRSIGTTEAVVAIAAGEVDREAAWREGISVVRAVDGILEGALAGSPAAGSLIEDWRTRVLEDGEDGDELMMRARLERGPDEAIALPYPRGRQCPHPDASATLVFRGVPAGDRIAELHALLRGIAAHGGWMIEAAEALCGVAAPPVLVGAPYRLNGRLAALSAAVAGTPLELVDLAAPVASGAAALAADRDGLAGEVHAPTRLIDPDRVTDDGFVDRFRAAIAESAVSARPPTRTP
ncbi:FGGY family carbohydrate kinase [Microbacterium sp. DT81.1]|uniref:FGGY family carbohydrate kinase n=1 Tax=Microbacterium sp. DT81.1 TaxID=3393413 RepID=UPI003CE75326